MTKKSVSCTQKPRQRQRGIDVEYKNIVNDNAHEKHNRNCTQSLGLSVGGSIASGCLEVFIIGGLSIFIIFSL